MIDILQKIPREQKSDQVFLLEFDSVVNPAICPLNKRLFLCQKQEVRWMHRLRNNHKLQIPASLKNIFLDTGYHVDGITMDVRKENELQKVEVSTPSGILASQVGSVKTVSMIALIIVALGSLKVGENSKAEEYKMNDSQNRFIAFKPT